MGGHKTISGSSYPTPAAPAPTPCFTVVGDPPGTVPDPDCRGNYYKGSVLNGKDYYPRMDNTYYVWYSILKSSYVLSVLLGVDPTDYWIDLLPYPEGLYFFRGDFIGDVLLINWTPS